MPKSLLSPVREYTEYEARAINIIDQLFKDIENADSVQDKAIAISNYNNFLSTEGLRGQSYYDQL